MSGATSLLHEFTIDRNFIMHESPHVLLLLFCLPSCISGRDIKIEMMETKLLLSLLLSGMTVRWRDDFVIFFSNSFLFPFSSQTHFTFPFSFSCFTRIKI